MTVHEQRLADVEAAGRVGPGARRDEVAAAIALDELDEAQLYALSNAAELVAAEHPLEYVGGMPARQADAWLTRLHELEAQQLARLGADAGADEFRHEWVDVLTIEGDWVGQWSSSRAAAALSCSYWHRARVVRAGVGIAPPKSERDDAARVEAALERRAAREREAMQQGLLAGLDW